MSAENFTTLSTSAEQTAGFAALLAPVLSAGDVILLQGHVGAGKTHFARALIQSVLGMAEDVPSPTFTLVQTYPAHDCDIWHADLYRLTSVQEVEELGLVDAFENDICLVEWPDRLGPLAPEHALTLTIEAGPSDDARVITANWTDAKWGDKINRWRK
ncbi:MAG: tRNA (adenosine(37)-N6)-threonylcarbamoyltransferase complex ATPase subunit type 1 TsaE [Sulfitobacter sp.]